MSGGIRPVFSYYGGKWRAAPRYPAPQHDTIVEPFAGSAGYASRYPDRRVVLIEKNPKIAGAWRYLLRATASEIRALPLLAQGQSVDDLPIHQEARWLIGLCVNKGAASPRKSLTAWASSSSSKSPLGAEVWGSGRREQLAVSIDRIRHWTLIEGDYTAASDIVATWFIDPPYQIAGKYYPTKVQDYASLGAWCRSRRGQVMVCENVGAEWLPFTPFRDIKANESRRGGKVSREALWVNG
jgi:hypothetical protein